MPENFSKKFYQKDSSNKQSSSGKKGEEPHKTGQGSDLRDFILGGQDGLVNVLAVILGVAVATNDIRIIIIAGLAATFGESISMAAVAYTSFKAEYDFYQSELAREKREIKEVPEMEKKEIRDIYYKKGFRGTLLNQVVNKITSNEKVWLETMMTEELHLYKESSKSPMRTAAIVGIAAVIGSLIPLLPFLFFGVSNGIIVSVILSTFFLFLVGSVKAKITAGNWIRSGTELAAIGMAAAMIGFGIGSILGVTV